MTTPTLEEVLDAFAMESNYDRETLEIYLHRYPQFSTDLVDMSRQLERPVSIDTAPLSAHVMSMIDTAWREHVAVRPAAAADPLAALDLAKSREIARAFGLPRQVVTALNERRVVVTSIPKRFLSQFADRIGSTIDALLTSLSGPMAQSSHSHSSDIKPVVLERMSFEQLLIDSNVPAEQRAALLAEGE